MLFLVNAYSPKLLDVVASNLHWCIGHIMWGVLGNILCDVWYPEGQGHLMYFLVNTSPKLLDVATSNLAGA